MRKKNILIILLIIATVFLYQINVSYELLISTRVLIGIMIINIFVIAYEINNSFIKYKQPKIIWRIIEICRYWLIKRQMDRIFMQKNEQEITRQFARIALEKVRSTDFELKIAGLNQLYQISKEADYPLNEHIYQHLINCVGNEPDETSREAIIDAICYFRKSRLYKRKTM